MTGRLPVSVPGRRMQFVNAKERVAMIQNFPYIVHIQAIWDRFGKPAVLFLAGGTNYFLDTQWSVRFNTLGGVPSRDEAPSSSLCKVWRRGLCVLWGGIGYFCQCEVPRRSGQCGFGQWF